MRRTLKEKRKNIKDINIMRILNSLRNSIAKLEDINTLQIIGLTANFIVDTLEDLPLNIQPGSTVFCLETREFFIRGLEDSNEPWYPFASLHRSDCFILQDETDLDVIEDIIGRTPREGDVAIITKWKRHTIWESITKFYRYIKVFTAADEWHFEWVPWVMSDEIRDGSGQITFQGDEPLPELADPFDPEDPGNIGKDGDFYYSTEKKRYQFRRDYDGGREIRWLNFPYTYRDLQNLYSDGDLSDVPEPMLGDIAYDSDSKSFKGFSEDVSGVEKWMSLGGGVIVVEEEKYTKANTANVGNLIYAKDTRRLWLCVVYDNTGIAYDCLNQIVPHWVEMPAI